MSYVCKAKCWAQNVSIKYEMPGEQQVFGGMCNQIKKGLAKTSLLRSG